MAKIKTGPKVKRKGGGVPAKSRVVDALADQLSGSTARLFAGTPPPLRFTLGPVLIFAIYPPKTRSPRSRMRRTRAYAARAASLRLRRTYPDLLNKGVPASLAIAPERAQALSLLIMRARDPRAPASRPGQASRSAPACS